MADYGIVYNYYASITPFNDGPVYPLSLLQEWYYKQDIAGYQIENDYSPWVTQRTNLWGNPRAVSDGLAFAAASSGSSSFITDFPGPVTTARRWTSNGTS